MKDLYKTSTTLHNGYINDEAGNPIPVTVSPSLPIPVGGCLIYTGVDSYHLIISGVVHEVSINLTRPPPNDRLVHRRFNRGRVEYFWVDDSGELIYTLPIPADVTKQGSRLDLEVSQKYYIANIRVKGVKKKAFYFYGAYRGLISSDSRGDYVDMPSLKRVYVRSSLPGEFYDRNGNRLYTLADVSKADGFFDKDGYEYLKSHARTLAYEGRDYELYHLDANGNEELIY